MDFGLGFLSSSSHFLSSAFLDKTSLLKEALRASSSASALVIGLAPSKLYLRGMAGLANTSKLNHIP